MGDEADIGWASRQLRAGFRVTRVGWNGKGMWLQRKEPDAGSDMTLPYTYLRTVSGDLVPWTCSQSDFDASDWQLA